MVNWQVTVTTIHCEAVDGEVTLMVHKDRSARCSGQKKYGQPTSETRKRIQRKSEQLSRKLGCQGLECSRLTQYRDTLFAAEKEGKVNGR